MLKKAARGFTLIELMIVVAIIGILAAIAIPNFLQYQLKAKRGEGSVNVAAIRTSEISYHAEHGGYVSADKQPTTAPGPTKQSFGAPNAGFKKIGWQPEGTVFGQYQVVANATGSDFIIVSAIDVDGDDKNACWVYGKGVTSKTAPSTVIPSADCELAGGVAWSVADDNTNNVERVFLASPGDVF